MGMNKIKGTPFANPDLLFSMKGVFGGKVFRIRTTPRGFQAFKALKRMKKKKR